MDAVRLRIKAEDLDSQCHACGAYGETATVALSRREWRKVSGDEHAEDGPDDFDLCQSCLDKVD